MHVFSYMFTDIFYKQNLYLYKYNLYLYKCNLCFYKYKLYLEIFLAQKQFYISPKTHIDGGKVFYLIL